MTERQQIQDNVYQVAEDWRSLATVIDRLLFTISFIVLLGIAFWMIVKSTEHPYIEGCGAVAVISDH